MNRYPIAILVLLISSGAAAGPHGPSGPGDGSLPTYLAPKPAANRLARGEKESRPGGLVADLRSGALTVRKLAGEKPDGELTLPLEHTDVRIVVSGFVARAEVTQRYGNPFEQPIEAVYTFPLPEDAAVDAMTMKIGARTIKGEIKKRAEARKIYEQAKRDGKRAALLDQERPNVFTQAVANIMPGDAIEIVITYVDILKYEAGSYELVFPMVVGPRYIPGGVTGRSGTGYASDTDRVPDASRITPPVVPPGSRSGHDIALSVELDAGVVIQGLYSTSHALDVWDLESTKRWVELSPADTVPNKDFVLRYQTAGPALQAGLLGHHDERGGFFTLLVQPQREIRAEQIVPRELIFIVDTSGSMGGFPIAKSKEAMGRLIAGMRQSDRFNIVRFAGGTGTLWSAPRPYTAESAREALAFVDGFEGSGGTEMAKGITAALSQPAAEGYLRIAFLLTDGYVHEAEVFDSINAERRGARVFTLGVGSSTNRYLLDRAAMIGRGEAFFVRQDEESKEVIDRFFKRVDRPALANIEIDWGGLEVEALYPARIPDLFAGQPLRIHGRYASGGDAEIVITGQVGTKSFEQRLAVVLPTEAGHEAMASVWARQKIKSLMIDRTGRGADQSKLIADITQTGLDFRLLTQWTSFVAVEEKVVNQNGKSVRVVQPVELPESVDYEGVFGDAGGKGFSSLSGARMGGAVGNSFGIGGLGGGSGRGTGGLGNVDLGRRRKASVRPKIMMSAPMVSASLPRDSIQKVISRSKNQIRYCYEKALQRNQTLQGKVVVSFVINAQGAVVKVTIKSSTLNNPEVQKCIVRVIQRLRFPMPAGGGTVEVNYPFVFRAG